MAKKRKEQETDEPKKKGFLQETIEAILVAIVMALVIREFGVQAFKIPSGSMKQTLLVGDQILVNKFKYGIKIPFTDSYLFRLKQPKPGDVVVFKFPQDPSRDFIKRIVAVEGDKVQVIDKQLYVNDELRPDAFAQHTDNRVQRPVASARDYFGPITVREGHVFVMGDNRDNSHDSRFWGELDANLIRGSAFMIYFSKDSTIRRNWGAFEALGNIPGLSRLEFIFQGGVRWDRIGKIIA